MSGHGGKGKFGCLGEFLSMMISALVIQAFGPENVVIVGLAIGGIAVVFALAGWRGGIAGMAACGILFLGIPPSTWLSLAILLGIVLASLEKRLSQHAEDPVTQLAIANRPDAPPPENSKGRQFASSICKGLKETAVGIAIALAVLVVINATIRDLDPNQLDLHPVEAALLYTQIEFGRFTAAVYIPALLLSVVLALFWPHRKPVERTLKIFRWIKRPALPLTILSTFTLFTAASHASYQGIWALAHREELVKNIEAVRLWRQAAVAAARAEAHFEQMPPAEQDQLGRQFRSYVAASRSTVNAARFGTEIGSNSNILAEPEFEPDWAIPAAGQETEASLQRTAAWAESPARAEPPGKRDLEICAGEATRAQAVYTQARAALMAILQSKIPMPPGEPFVKPFVDSMVGSTVKKSMESILPKSVTDFASARAWWREYEAKMTGYNDRLWNWTGARRNESDEFHAAPAESTPDALLAARLSVAVTALETKYAEAVVAEEAAFHTGRRSGAVEEEEEGEGFRRRPNYEPEPEVPRYRPAPEPVRPIIE